MPTNNTIKLNRWLAPLSLLYGMGVKLRNRLFDWKILPSVHYPVPVICIGNLAVGGTGKTPHTEYLIRLLKDQYKIAVLSRGYKRKSAGFVLADSHSTSLEIGDEPFQMKQKFPDIMVAVDANRRRGIRLLLELPAGLKPDVILLDDAFQHRYVAPSLSILLTDYHRLFYLDKLLPQGLLREPTEGIERADMVIVTKCGEDLKPIDVRIIEENMKLRAHQSLHFTKIVYGEMEPVFSSASSKRLRAKIGKEDEILLIAGIASPGPFIKEAEKYSDHVINVTFPDHHTFTKGDFKKLQEIFERMPVNRRWILTTEKDAARLKNNPLVPKEWKKFLFYLPITIDFCIDNDFDKTIKKHINTAIKNNLH